MADEHIEKLRAELAGLTGGSRLGPLLRLGQALMDRCWRGGIGRAAGLPDLNEAIERMEEAYGYTREDDAYRGTIAAYAGWFRCVRYTVDGQADEDRETGLRMLEVALAATVAAPMLRTMSLIWASQLYLGRIDIFMRSPGAAMNLMSGQVPAEVATQADRAAECLREVVESKPASTDLAEMAETFLGMAEMMRGMLRGEGAGMDVGRLMEAMASLQKFQARFSGPGAPASTPSFLAFGDIQKLLRTDVLDRPAFVLREEADQERPTVVDAEAVEVAEPVAEPAPEPLDRQRLRGLVRAALCGEGGLPELAALLDPTAPAPEVDAVDEAVALARTVVDLDDGEDAAPEDWFALAVALGLRHRLDPDGLDGDDGDDRALGLRGLLTAVRTLPAGHVHAGTLLTTLGAFLRAERPFGDTLEDVAEEFADRIDAVLAVGTSTDAGELATLHALRCLCRAATAFAELQRAPVPVEYPWRAMMLAAARVTER